MQLAVATCLPLRSKVALNLALFASRIGLMKSAKATCVPLTWNQKATPAMARTKTAAAVAREMVVYLRREAGHSQGSVYLDFRNHVHAGVHRIQDFLLSHPEQRTTLDQLARLAGLSQRQLTRVFRRQTGISISAFRTRIRLEHAQTLINNPALSIEDVAQQCGFLDDRQLRRLWKQTYGVSPRQSRA